MKKNRLKNRRTNNEAVKVQHELLSVASKEGQRQNAKKGKHNEQKKMTGGTPEVRSDKS